MLRLLVVDPEPLVCATLKSVMESYCGAYTVDIGDTPSALDIIKTQRFDCAIIDIGRPSAAPVYRRPTSDPAPLPPRG